MRVWAECWEWKGKKAECEATKKKNHAEPKNQEWRGEGENWTEPLEELRNEIRKRVCCSKWKLQLPAVGSLRTSSDRSCPDALTPPRRKISKHQLMNTRPHTSIYPTSCFAPSLESFLYFELKPVNSNTKRQCCVMMCCSVRAKSRISVRLYQPVRTSWTRH